ncbi:MAG: hypothetical protein WC364_14030 [Eubacteriales bacterium]|jgi:hypothetical protein
MKHISKLLLCLLVARYSFAGFFGGGVSEEDKNATHTGDVTGSSALIIAANRIYNSMFAKINAATLGYSMRVGANDKVEYKDPNVFDGETSEIHSAIGQPLLFNPTNGQPSQYKMNAIGGVGSPITPGTVVQLINETPATAEIPEQNSPAIAVFGTRWEPDTSTSKIDGWAMESDPNSISDGCSRLVLYYYHNETWRKYPLLIDGYNMEFIYTGEIFDISGTTSIKLPIVRQNSEPGIRDNSCKYWRDTANNITYLLVDVDGNQYSVAMTATGQ